MTNEELDKWFDDLSYEDKCAAIHCTADDTYSVKELKEMYTPEEMLEATYLRRTFEPNHWYDSDLEDKQMFMTSSKGKRKGNDIQFGPWSDYLTIRFSDHGIFHII